MSWVYPSFVKPLPVPGVDPTSGAAVCIQVNPAWIPYILGACDIFRHDSTWKGTASEIETASRQALNLLNLVAAAGICGGDMDFPVGGVIAYPAGVLPLGWLKCDGSAVSRTDYAALFAVLSTVYGAGDGTTTFNLPNLVDRFPLGAGAAGLGATGGESEHVLTAEEMPAHAHTTQFIVNGFVWPDSGPTGLVTPSLGPGVNTGIAGGNAPHNNMPPYLGLHYCIYAGGGDVPGCVDCATPSAGTLYDFVPLDPAVTVVSNGGIYTSLGYSFLRVTGNITIDIGTPTCVKGIRVSYRRVSNAGNNWSHFEVPGVGVFEIQPPDEYTNTNILYDYLFPTVTELSTLQINKNAGGLNWYIEYITLLVCP